MTPNPTIPAEPRDDDCCFDLSGLSRYSGLSVRTLRRHMDDPVHPLPTHHIRTSAKDRGRILIRKREFDAWVDRFPPVRTPRTDAEPMNARVARALARSKG